ncbi:MAG: RNA polymerase sigma factor [Prolixibacteraceae bacterium]|nr:RNA polymerase sigma factor [Prolixibacteraceae bacterium]
MIDRDDTYYLNLVLSGDTAAFSYLVERYSDMVYSLVLKMLKNETDAEDLTQEIFISVYKSLDKFRGNSKFSTWIYRITYNKAISKLRKSNRIVLSEVEKAADMEDYDEEAQHAPASTDEQLQQLEAALQALPDDEQVLIMLYYYENESVEAIASITKLSESNVKVKLFRIRKKLKEVLERQNSITMPVIH